MQSLNELLSQPYSNLHELLRHSTVLQTLNKKILNLLPDFLASQCHVAAWEDDTVIIHANNGSAGTVLRYQLMRLLPLLQQDSRYHKIKHLICRIRPTMPTTLDYNAALGKPYRSDKAAILLAETAADIQDPNIQAALQRLAQHVKISNNSSSH